MNFFVLAPLVAAIINTFLGVFVFTQSPRSHANRVYLPFSLGLAFWNIGVLLMFFAESPEVALTISRALHLPVIFLLFFLIHIVLLIFDIKIRKVYYLGYTIPIALGAFTFTDFIIQDVKYSGYSYYGVAGPGFHIFTALLGIAAISFLPIAFKKFKAAGGFERQKIKSLLFAYFILLFSGLHDTLPVFEVYQYPILGTTVYPLGTIGSIIFAVLLAYSVLQHQILNIYTNLGRITATSARLFFLFLLFFLALLTLTIIFPDRFTYFSIFSSIILFIVTTTIGSILFPKLIGIGEEYIEKRLLGDRFEYQDKIKGFTQQILYYSSERLLYSDLHETLVGFFQFQSYCLFTLDKNSEAFSLVRSHPDIPTKESYTISTRSRIAEYFKASDSNAINSYETKLYLDLNDFQEDQTKHLSGLTTNQCFPLRSGGELLGFLMLGKKIRDRPVTNLDFQLILELSANLALFINYTHLKKQVAQSQELELLGNLSRGLAHDLNNLITPISTYCQITEDIAEKNESLKSFAAVAQRNLSTMQSYIREALFFSTNQEPQTREIPVSTILNNLKSLYETTLAARGIELSVSCPDDIVMTVDDVLLQRLLSNLIHNAADASPENSVIELSVKDLKRTLQRKRWIRFIVRDYGSGISEREIEKVFTPYYTTKDIGDNKRGSGLGLSICRRIVQLHNGDINITSTIDHGTQVTIDLPEPVNSSEAPASTPAATKVGASSN